MTPHYSSSENKNNCFPHVSTLFSVPLNLKNEKNVIYAHLKVKLI